MSTSSILRRVPVTFALALGIGLLFALWSPAYGQAYRVQSGDSLWKLSRNFNVSVSNIKKANNLSSDLIIAGTTLEIPRVHTVQRGDSLYLLARQYETSIDAIILANDLKGTMIMVGEKLIIPNTVKPKASSSSTGRLSVTNHERELMARAVYSEARGEPFQGQVAVAAVIINRVNHPEFPNTVSGVIYEPWAFTAVHDGQFWLTPNQTAFAAVEEALAGSDPSGGAIFYYNPVTATNQWIRSRPVIASIGRHVFAR